ncbi:CMP/dCMP deaminase zinc-binding protein, partial [mine drainage metagenome]
VCPRHHMDVHKGVGFEICFSIHAEEAAINDMLISKHHRIEDSEGATVLVVRMKDGKFDRPKVQKPYCSKCSGRIYTQTLAGQVILCADGGFASFEREEYHIETMKNLTEYWKEQLHVVEK